MLHSTYYHKDTNEDPKTSAVFENLMLLPDNVFWAILKQSCFEGHKLPDVSGALLSYDFWPHWDKEGTTNKNFVEPDVFLRFEQFDVIIEAKVGELGGQYRQQWQNEVTAYLNEYNGGKSFFFIALGGNADMAIESLNVRKFKVEVFKCTWLSLLVSITRYQKQLEYVRMPDYYILAQKRLLDNIKLAFNLNGVYNINWFGDLVKHRVVINPKSISSLKNLFKYE